MHIHIHKYYRLLVYFLQLDLFIAELKGLDFKKGSFLFSLAVQFIFSNPPPLHSEEPPPLSPPQKKEITKHRIFQIWNIQCILNLWSHLSNCSPTTAPCNISFSHFSYPFFPLIPLPLFLSPFSSFSHNPF